MVPVSSALIIIGEFVYGSGLGNGTSGLIGVKVPAENGVSGGGVVDCIPGGIADGVA